MDQELWDKMTKFTPLTKMINTESLPNLEKIEDNIWVVRNFISPEDIEIYSEYAENIEEEEWWKKNKDWWVGKYIPIDNSSPLYEISKKLSDKIRTYVNEDVYLGTFGSLHRLVEGQGMFIHTDNPTEIRDINDENNNKIGETSGHNNYCILAMVVYLSSFNGGELYFPNLGIDYKSQPGDLVLFPGTGVEYDHGVRVVLPGPKRYITTGFGYDKKAEALKKTNYVFEDTKTGKLVDLEPSLISNNPEEVMKLPPRPIS